MAVFSVPNQFTLSKSTANRTITHAVESSVVASPFGVRHIHSAIGKVREPATNMDVLQKLNLPNHSVRSGKVRDMVDLGRTMLIVASDRISAFDCILPTPIPRKGRILTALSAFWFDRLADITPNHFMSVVDQTPPPGLEDYADVLRGRAMLCQKAEVIPIECVVRGYLAGSGWNEYRESQSVCGVVLPGGLRQSSKLPEPIFTPATKAESGHDENISFERAAEIAGRDVMRHLRDVSIALFEAASKHAERCGLILADTKFEFGFIDGQIYLVDEALTPDSSRYWPADDYEPGRDQKSFDKQFVRNYLLELCAEGKWDKTDPAPPLPEEIAIATMRKYVEAYEKLTGTALQE